MSEKYIGNFGARLYLKEDESDAKQVTICFANGYGVNIDEFSKPDAIDLGKRLLEHFDVLPTKEELEACDIIETLLQDEMNRYDAAGMNVPEWFHKKRAAIEATIAKLRRLVAEEWERRVNEGQDTE